MGAVPHHHPATGIVTDIGEPVDIGGDLGLQRRRQHPPCTITDQLIQHRHRDRFVLLRILLTNYREHRRTFPTGVGAPALLEGPVWGYREGTSLPPLRALATLAADSSTGFKHCSSTSTWAARRGRPGPPPCSSDSARSSSL